MAKKDKKSKTSEQKARALAKQSKKAAKGEKKTKIKGAGRDDDSDAEDVDLDSVLAIYAQEQAKFLKVTEQPCEAPSPRASSTVIASPSNKNELLVFGGEYFDGTVATFFNELFVYLIDRGEWRQITSPNSPLPRSGHAWSRGGNSGGIYLFGGEFSSPKQGTFYHYNDFWYLDPSTREWNRIESKGKGPPARSGHRMTYYKNYILLFGGFQDTSQQTKYMQDLWIYDCQNFVWHEAKLAINTQKPDSRSSFSFLPHESGAVLYGGYSRVKAITIAGKQGKGGPQRNILKPVIHQDTWFLRVTPPATEAATGTPPSIKWERRKKPANPPNPNRAGATMAHHKGRGILFGGVHDVEESEEGIDSEFFDALFVWNVDRNRFFPLTLRRAKAAGKRQPVQNARGKNRGKADEEELLRNLAALEAKGSIADAADIEMEIDSQPIAEVIERKEFPIRFEMPHRRFNAQLVVQEDTLFIFSGTFERGDQEFTFNDLYSVDLGKLDGVREIFNREPANWNNKMDESEDEDEDGDEDSEAESDSDDAMSIDAASTAPTEASTAPTELSEASAAQQLADVANETEITTSAQQDPRPFPRPFENLRDFHARTSIEWQNILLEKLKYGSSATSEQSIKELRKKAFEAAEERWWDCREEVRTLEDEQEEAGIGEVVSIADRGAEGGGGRRR